MGKTQKTLIWAALGLCLFFAGFLAGGGWKGLVPDFWPWESQNAWYYLKYLLSEPNSP